MNPFTRFLLQKLPGRERKGRDIAAFVEHWDAFEELVIRVYKGKSATLEDESEHRKLHTWLGQNYTRWQSALKPFWQLTRVEGVWVKEDPFLALLAVPRAVDFVSNWPAMQMLPAAREALNQFLLDRGNKDDAL